MDGEKIVGGDFSAMKRAYRSLYTALMIAWDFIAAWSSVFIGFRVLYGFSEEIPAVDRNYFWLYVFVVFATKVSTNLLFRTYDSIWYHASSMELAKQLSSSVLAFILLFVATRFSPHPIRVELLIITCAFLMLFILCGRLAVRLTLHVRARIRSYFRKSGQRKVLIYGAGAAGEHLLRHILRTPAENLDVVGFMDDDPRLQGHKVFNVRVLGTGKDLKKLVRDKKADEVIVAIPTAEKEFLKDVLVRCQQAGCKMRRYGRIDEVTLLDLDRVEIKEINLEELLHRDSVKLNMDAVKTFISGKVILVTGGAGSIGSEICRQVLRFGAKKLIILDFHENGLFDIENELLKQYDHQLFEVVLASVRDKDRLQEVFDQYSPQIVFHAAAHKHVPMMEKNPKEAVKNNVFGTLNVARQSTAHGVDKFILISTDKAVNPTNIMGATKRIAELVIQMTNRYSDTEFAAVRFGNVLGSNGSVVPYFEKQIAQGGPVTVTHPDMRRYFMTIPEAVQLVLEAGSMARGGEIFVLDMGETVRIYDMACDLIRLSGYTPGKDIDIVITGLRPGEKLFEEISLKEEDTSKTPNNKIYINKPVYTDPEIFSDQLAALSKTVEQEDLNKLFCAVKQIVPTFQHKGWQPVNDPEPVPEKELVCE